MIASKIKDAFSYDTQGAPEELRWKKRRILRALRETFGMDVAFISRFDNDMRVFDEVDMDPEIDLPGPLPGGSGPLGDSYCYRIYQGTVRNVLNDAQTVSAVQDIAETRGFPIGAHVSVPIVLPGGLIYGMLCAFSRRPDPSLGERDHATFRLCAELLSRDIEMTDDMVLRGQPLRSVIEQAIHDRHFSFELQPIVDLTTGRQVGAEMLTRFHHSLGATEEVFRTARYLDLVSSVEEAIVEASRAVLRTVPEDQFMTLNLSASGYDDIRLETLFDAQERRRIVIELTEHERIFDYPRLAQRVRYLREAGLRTAIDDVGAGYASFRHVMQLRPDIMKLDRGFISGIAADPNQLGFVRAMIDYGRAAGMEVIAEGIETEGELALLRDIGPCWGQGYMIGRPVPVCVRTTPA